MMVKKKSLGLWTLTALVAGNMIGSGVFLLPASLAKFGSIGLVAWILTAFGAMALALVFSRISRILPKTGGPYAYCREAYGDFVGFQIAYCYWVALCVGNAAIAVAFVGYLSVFWPTLATSPMQALIASIGVVWLLTWINIWGVRQAGIVQLVTFVLKLVPLAFIGTYGLGFVKAVNLQAFNVSHASNFSAITAAATLTLWSFIGFESATVPAGDVENPVKNIPRATILGTGIAAVVYILSTLAVMGVVPMSQLAQSPSPYATAATYMLGHEGGVLIAIVAVIACFGTLNGWVLLQGQIPMAAARDKLFPAQFAKLSKNGTPVFALTVSSLLITVLLIMRYGASLVDEFTFIILLATLASLIPYIYTAAAELILLYRAPDQVNKAQLKKSLPLSMLAFLYAFWAIAGADYQVIVYGLMLLLTSIPVYVWLLSKRL